MFLKDILQDRIHEYDSDIVTWNKKRSSEYIANWNKGVEFFQKIINKERQKDKMKPVSFISIRQKLIALREIDDLRWFYRECIRYSNTKDKQGKRNTFSKCFWGSLKIR